MTTAKTYYATIRHHSISRAREIEINGTLTSAKRAATKEFGDGYLDHEIVIYEMTDWGPHIVATRRIADSRWN